MTPRHATRPRNSGRSAPNSAWRMVECTPSAPISASPRAVLPSAKRSVTPPASCSTPVTVAEMDRVALVRQHCLGEHAVQVGAVEHQIGKA